MAEKRLKIAIIGAGMIANAGHIPGWKSRDQDVEVVGVYNRLVALKNRYQNGFSQIEVQLKSLSAMRI